MATKKKKKKLEKQILISAQISPFKACPITI